MENITENNRLIAKFMGYTSEDDGFLWLLDDQKSEDDFKYHSDWNELMEVVEKIESLEKNGYKYAFSLTTISVRFLYRGSRVVDLPIDYSKLNATYKAVVAFIQWYNNQSKD